MLDLALKFLTDELNAFILARTGASFGLSAQICAWHCMQVSVAGMPAKALSSTDVWQYRQSMPIPAT